MLQEGLSKLARLGAPPQHLALVAESALVAWGADLDAWQRQQQQQQQQDAPAGRRGQGAGGGGGSSAPPLLGAQHVAEALREVTEVPERSMVGGPVVVVVVVVEVGPCGLRQMWSGGNSCILGSCH